MMDVLKGPSQEQLSAEAVLQASLQRVKWLGAFCHAAYLSKLMYRRPLSRDKCMLHINSSFAKFENTRGDVLLQVSAYVRCGSPSSFCFWFSCNGSILRPSHLLEPHRRLARDCSECLVAVLSKTMPLQCQ